MLGTLTAVALPVGPVRSAIPALVPLLSPICARFRGCGRFADRSHKTGQALFAFCSTAFALNGRAARLPHSRAPHPAAHPAIPHLGPLSPFFSSLLLLLSSSLFFFSFLFFSVVCLASWPSWPRAGGPPRPSARAPAARASAGSRSATSLTRRRSSRYGCAAFRAIVAFGLHKKTMLRAAWR